MSLPLAVCICSRLKLRLPWGSSAPGLPSRNLFLHLDPTMSPLRTCDLDEPLRRRRATVVVPGICCGCDGRRKPRVAAVGQVSRGCPSGRIEWTASHRIVDGLAIDLGGTGAVVEGTGTAFDFQRTNAHFGQALDCALDGAQILEFMM